MSNDLNQVLILGCIARETETRPMGQGKMYIMTISGEREIVNNAGKTVNIPYYQQVQVRGKEGEEAAKLAVGTPVYVEGSLNHRQWDDDAGNKRQATTVRGRTVRAVHGIDPARVVADAQGNARLKDGYCRAQVVMRVAGDADYRILNGGNAVINFRGGCNDSWAVLEDGALVWKEHTNWFRAVAWGDLAEHLSSINLGKGATLLLEGDIENGSYEDKQTGRKVYTTTISASAVYPLGRRGEAAAETIPAKGATAAYSGSTFDDVPMDDFAADDSLPF